MKRIDLYVTKEQFNKLKQLAQNGLSVSEHIRRAIDEYLSKFKEQKQ